MLYLTSYVIYAVFLQHVGGLLALDGFLEAEATFICYQECHHSIDQDSC